MWWTKRASQENSKAQAVSGPVPEKFLQFLPCTMGSVLYTRSSFFLPLQEPGEALVHRPQMIFTMKMFFLAQLTVCVSNFNNVI